jgi:EAL domain-containing protein (putative c-di-GMP-specific phosphodiesterase class I)
LSVSGGQAKPCEGCKNGEAFDLPFTMAFQPIVDVHDGALFAHEALVRGVDGQGAGAIFGAVDPANRYAFDQKCRVKAIELATTLDLITVGGALSINFLPNSVYEPRACIRLTLETAARVGLPIDRIIFEFTESERLDTPHALNVLATYRKMGFKTAIDDFGAGHAGLSLLTKFQPDIVKLDMTLIRGIDRDPVKRGIVRNVATMMKELGIIAICEGVETHGELAVLKDLDLRLVQGFLIARPALASLVGKDAILRSLGLTAGSASDATRAD